jgi:hypothetical protein
MPGHRHTHTVTLYYATNDQILLNEATTHEACRRPKSCINGDYNLLLICCYDIANHADQSCEQVTAKDHLSKSATYNIFQVTASAVLICLIYVVFHQRNSGHNHAVY